MIAAATRLLWDRLRGSAGAEWKETCRAGAPVPEAHRCAALHCASVPLMELAEGRRGIVSCLQEPESRDAAKLAALGILPGVEITLVQRYPAFVLRMGYAEFALDSRMAGHIRLLVEED
jgi:DtxR family transcriptional regulator, Mn-dependent transcriptional regulator